MYTKKHGEILRIHYHTHKIINLHTQSTQFRDRSICTLLKLIYLSDHYRLPNCFFYKIKKIILIE